MLLSYKPLHLEAQQRPQGEGCVVDITHQQAGMETTTPPTQLPAPVVLGESGGRRDEGGPIVADVIAPIEQRVDDEMEEDPMSFLNTGAYDDDLHMMSQPYNDSGYQHADEDMDHVPVQEYPSRVDCKKSFFMQSSHDMPEDATSTQAQLAGGRTVLSPTTLGRG